MDDEEEAAEEIFGEKEVNPVFFELSSYLFAVSFSIREVGTADLGVLLPRAMAREGNGHPEVLMLGLSGLLLVGQADFGVTLVVAGKDCLVVTVGEGE